MITRRRRGGTLLKIGTAAMALSVMLLGGLTATRPDHVNAGPPDGVGNGTKEVSAKMRKADAPIVFADEKGLPVQALGDENRVPRIGDEKYWIALDDTRGTYYLKKFKLRSQSDGAEVWVALNLNFPTDGQVDPRTPGATFDYNDCRNGERTTITDQQLGYMLEQFDTNIRPTDVDWFGEPAVRTGKQAQLPQMLATGHTPAQVGRGNNTYYDKTGRDVILVDNVRDDNWYDENNANTYSYIAGFFTTAMPFYHDRNVITIDAFDWIHRTGADPDHDPTADPCDSAPARPFLYEGVFAHEYQHLIHNDYDADEVNWVNEGLSDFAEILTGYSTPSRRVDEKGNDSHTLNFLGWGAVTHPDWNPIPRDSGPENSLTVWGDQGDDEILEDYGHAYYFMTYLQSQGYDQSFFTSWAHNPLNGIDGLNDALGDAGSSDTFESLFLDMQTSALVDAFVDEGAAVSGDAIGSNLQNSDNNATIHFTKDAYDTTGAPPWGSDFLPLGSGAALTSVGFNGDEQFFFDPGPQWVENTNGYFSVVATGQYPNMADLSITHQVTLDGSDTLTFNHYYDTEPLWDFGFVQVSIDNGQTWDSLACTGTTSDHDPAAIPSIVANMPGYTGTAGTAGTPLAASCTLPSDVGPALIAFRFMSDPSVQLTGWFVKNVQVDGAPVGTPGDLTGWSNEKFYDPAALDFTLRLVGITGAVDQYGHVTSADSVVVVNIPLDGDNDGSATTAQLTALSGASQVFAIVSGVPEVEDNGIYGPYSLEVNGGEVADGAGVTNPW